MIDSELPTDRRRPCTPSHPRKSAPHHRDFLGTPGSRGPALSPTPRSLRFRRSNCSVQPASLLTQDNQVDQGLGGGGRQPGVLVGCEAGRTGGVGRGLASLGTAASVAANVASW